MSEEVFLFKHQNQGGSFFRRLDAKIRAVPKVGGKKGEIVVKFATKALHAGQKPDRETRARAVPIYQTTSYVFESTEHAAALFNLEGGGYIYTRIDNPTTEVLENRIAALEGGIGALAVASGQAAITFALLNLASAGDEIVASSNLYGGTYTLLANTFKSFGINVRFTENVEVESFEKLITPKTRALYVETIGNPGLTIPDFEALSKLAQSYKIPLVVDNTFATPYLFRPLEHGANIVIHSLTKFIGGHGVAIGGIIVDGGNFDWKAGGFTQFTTPDPAYHGMIYTEKFGAAAYIARARTQFLRDIGASLSPFNAFLILLGVETLELRMKKHSENALKIAEYLKGHPKVTFVNYPGLSDHPHYNRAQKYFKNGFGAMLTFGVKGGREAGKKVIEGVKIFSHLANVGDAKSLIIHPASTTHSQLNSEELLKAGVTEDLIRLSIGIEDVDDLIQDLDNALAQV